MKRSMNLRLPVLALALLALAPVLQAAPAAPAPASGAAGLATIKNYLLARVTLMDGAAHDFEANATAYQKLIDANGGDYNKAAIANGAQLLPLVAKMQGNYLGLHMNGYETVEGIAAGVKSLVEYDIYFDSGVPQSEASTDSPAAPILLKTASGEVIDNRNGNLFHYVIESALWGAKATLVRRLSPEASKGVRGVVLLPRADVLLAAAKDSVRMTDRFLAACQAWQPTVDECVGALVWMTPTFNGYFNDLRDSLYGANPSAYISESRVKDMRGIMGSLQLVYNAIAPELAKKDAALANQLKNEYAAIMAYIDETDSRDQAARVGRGKLSQAAIEEMGNHAKRMSDQLAPQLLQAAAIMGLRVPIKPTLA
jgi:hypothetical protein